MKEEHRDKLIAFISVAVIAFAVGFFISDDSSELSKLRAELAQHRPLASTAKGSNLPSFWKTRLSMPKNGEATPHAWGSGGPMPTNEFFTKLNISQEEWDKTWELNKRGGAGEYILKCERPTTKKFLDHDFTDIVTQSAEKRAPEYDRLFGQLGVSPDAAEQLKTHAAKIHRASLEAEVAIGQLLEARRDYDQRLRTEMNEEDYQRYRQHEEFKPAVREYQDFQNYAAEKNIAVDPRYEHALTGLMQEAQAYTSVSWHGPMDGLPQPTVGVENVIPAAEQQIGQLTEKANQLLGRSSDAGLPDNYKNLLEGYYAEKIQKKKEGVDQLKTTFANNTGSRSPVKPSRPEQ